MWQSGGAGSGGKPDKAGAAVLCLEPLSAKCCWAKGTNQAYPSCTLSEAGTYGAFSLFARVWSRRLIG